ncbi:MAG: hypothetical protein A3F13_02660 [Gammaproteobacteria bacterium RIFCSPHIGHO2_12_FULL_40_19]|nr:MAG: hypothetical protein A3F13_02660 [Gammaproteobacteria bacterium RIFCSPHIGHO2_12_FULL_40_19]
MSSLQQIYIAGSAAGLQTNVKPFMLNDQAFSTLENAYVWRERVKKRVGNRLLGRLRRVVDLGSLGNTGASPWAFNLYSTLVPPITPEANAEIEPGSVIIYIPASFTTGNISNVTKAHDCEIFTAAPHGLSTGNKVTIAGVVGMPPVNGDWNNIEVTGASRFKLRTSSQNWGKYVSGGTWTHTTAAVTFTDNGDGTLTGDVIGNTGIINYLTGNVTLTHTSGAGVAVTVDFGYFPGLPVMGIAQRESSTDSDEQTLFFDTVYAYVFVDEAFQEYLPGTTWTGTDYDFFLTTNYRGVNAYNRLFFVTNFNLNLQAPTTYDPIRYTNDGGAWTDFQPLVASTHTLWQAKILVPYYGRLLALNTWEGLTADTYTGAQNYFSRCRFSQVGDPVGVDSWRTDIRGKGGFIDAPVNEVIMSATFFKNTLIVFFEKSTWQLRYLGEVGFPFLWERISSDYGSESKMATILFDEGVATVGDKGIVSSNSLNVKRIDQQIPDLVFDFRNSENGIERVGGIRDFQRQLVFWNYCDSNLSSEDDPRIYPNRVLVYNYMNQTYAIFRDNITAFGTFQPSTGITWNQLDIYWDDNEVCWDDADTQSLFPNIVMGNQQGFVLEYGYTTLDDPGLTITGVTLANPIVLTSPNHNLESGEVVYLTGLNFVDGSNVPVATDLNERIFQVTRDDADTVSLSEWDTSLTTHQYIDDYSFTPASGTYVGGGKITLFPRMNIQTKDFNPYQDKGSQVKLSYIDFLTDVPGAPTVAMTVRLLLNSSPIAIGNVEVGNTQVEQYLPTQFYLPQSSYAWHRFFATTTGQYIRLQLTYDDDLMNTLDTHTSGWVLNAMSLWVRPGSRNTF